MNSRTSAQTEPLEGAVCGLTWSRGARGCLGEGPANEAIETSSANACYAPWHAAPVAGCIGLVSVVWFVLLSGWIGVVPGSVVVERENVLFNSDTSSWIGEMSRGHEPIAKIVHPLEVVLWRPPCRALRFAFGAFLSRERAELLAPRALVAVVAGAGVSSLAFVAVHNGVPLLECVLLFSMYLLFSSNITVALPEHFGISNGLLSLSFAVPVVIARARAKTTALIGLTALCGGTTITNVLYPLCALFQYGVNAVKARRNLLVAATLVIAVVIGLFIDSQREMLTGHSILGARVPGLRSLYLKTARVHIHVLDYLNLRLIVHPKSAVVYAIYAVVAPAIGPAPIVRISNGHQMVTYEAGQPLRWSRFGATGYDGLHLRDYLVIPAIGAILWTGLLIWCSYEAIQDRNTRSVVWLPLGWMLFNVLLHNVWGDELFLYAPHWSWALMALVILGARHLSRKAIASFVIPMMLCQAYTFLQVKVALAIISQ